MIKIRVKYFVLRRPLSRGKPPSDVPYLTKNLLPPPDTTSSQDVLKTFPLYKGQDMRNKGYSVFRNVVRRTL